MNYIYIYIHTHYVYIYIYIYIHTQIVSPAGALRPGQVHVHAAQAPRLEELQGVALIYNQKY